MTAHLDTYIPTNAIDLLKELTDRYDVKYKIVNQRHTKHGDFRKLANGTFQISINNNLNPYQFLLTLVHEIAHYVTFKEYGRVQPHGSEWKSTFQRLMLPFLQPSIYPKIISSHYRY